MPYRAPSPPTERRAGRGGRAVPFVVLALCVGVGWVGLRALSGASAFDLLDPSPWDGVAVRAAHGDHELRAGPTADDAGRTNWSVWIVHRRSGREEARKDLRCGYLMRGAVAWDGEGRAWFYCGDTAMYSRWDRAGESAWTFHALGSMRHPRERFSPPDALRGH